MEAQVHWGGVPLNHGSSCFPQTHSPEKKKQNKPFGGVSGRWSVAEVLSLKKPTQIRDLRARLLHEGEGRRQGLSLAVPGRNQPFQDVPAKKHDIITRAIRDTPRNVESDEVPNVPGALGNLGMVRKGTARSAQVSWFKIGSAPCTPPGSGRRGSRHLSYTLQPHWPLSPAKVHLTRSGWNLGGPLYEFVANRSQTQGVSLGQLVKPKKTRPRQFPVTCQPPRVASLSQPFLGESGESRNLQLAAF